MDLVFSETILDLKSLNQVIDQLKVHFKSRSLILLDGDLGAGKTTLISELLKSCGYADATSPTYALHHSYPIVLNHENIRIEHLDLYRLQNEDDVESSGLWDLFQDPQSIILVEWANRVSIDQWPMDWNRFCIKITKNDQLRTYNLYSF